MKKLFILLVLISLMTACSKEQIEPKSVIESVRFTQVNNNVIVCFETLQPNNGVMINRYPGVCRGYCLDENTKTASIGGNQYTVTFDKQLYNMQVDDIYYCVPFCEVGSEVIYGKEMKLMVK